MFLALLDQQDKSTYASAIEIMRRAYLTGEIEANEMMLNIPFAAQWNMLFPGGKEKGDSFDNEWQLNHFCNVTAAMAHIIHYAKKNPQLGWGEFTKKRSLNCMISAFYHDIGKTIIARRHGIEGKALFAEPKASVKFRFVEILAACDSEITTEDMLYYAELIGYHDIFGTISTGENGFLSLANVIGRFADILGENLETIKTAVCDLWLLNIADIITSLKDKGNVQEWQLNPPGSIDSLLENFLSSYKGKYLNEDLCFALQIAEAKDRRNLATELSEKRAAHRLQRLARQTFENGLAVSKDFPPNLKEAVNSRFGEVSFTSQIKEILRAEFGDEYEKKFGTMLQFDYALGFFQSLAKQAIYWLEVELKDPNAFRTGWLYNRKTPKDGSYPPGFLVKYNAECISNNYCIAIVNIFGEISRLTSDINNWNIEFEDAKNRLTPSKADKLLVFDGAYRASNTRSLLMREIMLYKS